MGIWHLVDSEHHRFEQRRVSITGMYQVSIAVGIWHLVDSSKGMYLSLWAGSGMYLSLGYGFKQRHVYLSLLGCHLVDSSCFYSVDRLSPVLVGCSVGVMYVQGVLALANEGARKAPPTKILVQRL